MIPWRFIDSGPLDGCSNMAVDEALLACFDPEKSRPVFRIYGWEPPALSLGRFQKGGEVLDRKRCTEAGVAVVRRITGGGVIYHSRELTYSIVCSPDHAPPAASIKESFRALTSFLVRFYGKLGLDPCYAIESFPDSAGLGGRSAFCFAGKECYDILIEGKKLGGNAQRRLKDVIFQHGSIPLVNCAGSGARLLRTPPLGIGECTTALRDLGVDLAHDELKRLMAQSFAETMGAAMEEDSLTGDEEATADTLASNKHSWASWVWEGTENRGKDAHRPQA
jgi:lipoate-protein ligase A